MRWWAAALGFGLILALCGCAPAKDITEGWAPMPAAKQFRPAAGTCHADVDQTTGLSPATGYKPVPCSGPHESETVAVFDLTPAEAASSDKRLAKAYAECAKRTNAWLGKDWRTGWTTILPLLPGDVGWTGGARWVRCDVAQTSPNDDRVLKRKGSMNGALKPGGKLLITCALGTLEKDDISYLGAAPCAARHNAEFAGLYKSKTSDLDDLTDAEMEKGCARVIAKFAGVPADGNLLYRVGWLGSPLDQHNWYRGDRAVRCFIYFGADLVTGSYRKAGTGRLPVN